MCPGPLRPRTAPRDPLAFQVRQPPDRVLALHPTHTAPAQLTLWSSPSWRSGDRWCPGEQKRRAQRGAGSSPPRTTTPPAAAGPAQAGGAASYRTGLWLPTMGYPRVTVWVPTHVDDVGELHCDKGLSWWLGGGPHSHCHHPGCDGQRGSGGQVLRSAPASGAQSPGTPKALWIRGRGLPGSHGPGKAQRSVGPGTSGEV